MKVIVAAIIFTLLPVVSLSNDRSTTVRDRYGNIVETRERHGDETTVRDRYGNITRTEQREGRQKIIRDRNGNIIGTE
ncbi:MAG: hypothetical protein NTY51_01675 [Deltaproteobacteria bacterium]|nr:hypothetical protein [Deltaproteobacteria bacterium]